MFVPLFVGWKRRQLKAGKKRSDVAAHLMPPKYVITDPVKIAEYVAYHKEHLPDTSHFPVCDPERTHFWKMTREGVQTGGKSKRLKGGKARCKPHSILTG